MLFRAQVAGVSPDHLQLIEGAHANNCSFPNTLSHALNPFCCLLRQMGAPPHVCTACESCIDQVTDGACIAIAVRSAPSGMQMQLLNHPSFLTSCKVIWASLKWSCNAARAMLSILAL